VARKKEPRATDRHARTKRREKIISAGAKARERKKNSIRAGAKKKIIRAGAKKNSGVNENTTHKKAYVQ
jgi:hypothetical protein